MEKHVHSHSFQVRSLGVIAIVLVATVVQFGVGIAFAGIALLHEAAHNLVDAPVYGLPALSERWAGLQRNGHTIRGCLVAPRLALWSARLLIISSLGFCAWGIAEATGEHQVDRPEILLLVACLGFVANLMCKQVFHYEAHVEFDSNKEASDRHVHGDVLASAVAVATYAAIWAAGWSWLDIAGTVLAGAVVVWANIGPATKPSPVHWHKRKNHPGGGTG